ncbi:TetR/AcrR family transcriptional regulator [Rhodobacteraceae bacterium WD3A24]|nr:TetR/AcrR family transcriptional regulator [Rhodobacteraceae bacterium WD3A24]
MPWEKQYDSDTVIERAMRHFWAHGYEGSSISDLVAATGLNRGSLYAGFGDKRGLFMESLRRYDRRERAGFLARLAAEDPPREAILAAFAAAATGRSGVPRGCLLVNTALERAPHDPELERFVNESFDGVRAFFRERLEAGQADGTIAPGLAPAATAEALVSLFLGLRVLHRSGAGETACRAVADRAALLLG